MKNQWISSIMGMLLVLLAWAAFPNSSLAQERVHDKVDEMPVPPGGMEGFTQYMIKTLKYPQEAKEAKIEGKVLVTFVVKSDGTVSSSKILQGIGGGCDEEALRVVANSGVWTPGKLDGKSVNTQITLPVQFKM
ncbi:hypothetical protein GCM10009119_29520 [Algoriphagus jejuensis]|uniref:TonB C-terminal domain-containing protein n=1 Tax=Algoriphagus jejuensis TaxID=419934 RepID=A0ABP3YFM6_9BACT